MEKQGHTLTPTSRFREFDDVWLRTRAEDVFSIFNGYAFSSNDAQDQGCRWIKIADVGILQMRSDNKAFLPEKFATTHKKFLLKEGDYVVALTRPILNGELKIAQIDKAHSNSLLNQRVGKLVTENEPGFIYFILQRRELVFQIEARIAGTDPPNLAPSEIASLPVFIPSLPEQKKIADFLTAVDRRIDQLIKKKALLEDYKMGVMQQLFTQAIRFRSDDGDAFPAWEEKKLGDIAQKKSSSITAGSIDDMAGDFPVYGASGVISGIETYAEDQEYIGIVKDGAGVGRTMLCEPYTSVLGTMDILKEKPGNHLRFIFGFLNRLNFSKHVTGSTIPHIYFKDYSRERIAVPSFREQKKIADFLSTIDRKIENVATQITETQTFKRGLLQQMFV